MPQEVAHMAQKIGSIAIQPLTKSPTPATPKGPEIRYLHAVINVFGDTVRKISARFCMRRSTGQENICEPKSAVMGETMRESTTPTYEDDGVLRKIDQSTKVFTHCFVVLLFYFCSAIDRRAQN